MDHWTGIDDTGKDIEDRGTGLEDTGTGIDDIGIETGIDEIKGPYRENMDRAYKR